MRPDLLLCVNLLIAALTAHADDLPKHQPGAATQAFIDRPAVELQWQHGMSFFGDFKYPPGFTHFDYVNPDAPKGGKLVRGYTVSWNSFTPNIIKGLSAPVNILGEMSLYDSLMWPSGDEVGVYYGNLAESIAISDDSTEVRIRLRPEARWHDGVPVTGRDIKFSFEHLKANGGAGVRAAFHVLEAVIILGEKEILVRFRHPINVNSMTTLLGKPAMLPEHYWRERDITETTLEPPLGSGPYRIGDFKAGKYVELVRVPDYWGQDLGIHRGRHNLDVLRFETYRDATVQREALKKGLLDVFTESNTAQWVSGYDQDKIERGVLRQYKQHWLQYVGAIRALGFNQEKERFTDVRVREALTLAFDLKWMNDVLFYGVYEIPESYFHGTYLAATGLPTSVELALLEPYREQLPEQVFTTAPFAASDHAALEGRDALIEARRLLVQSGWNVSDGVLRNAAGAPFKVKFLVSDPEAQAMLLAYQKRLRRLGISSEIRLLEVAQYINLLRKGDYDAVFRSLAFSLPPAAEVRAYLHSSSQGIYNFGRLASPAVDALSDRVMNADSRESLTAATRALDRVLFWQFYFVPARVVEPARRMMWNKLGQPSTVAPYVSGFPATWWWDDEKAKRVEQVLQRRS